MKSYTYYKGTATLLCRVSGKRIDAMIPGKGWFQWSFGDEIREENIITPQEAKEIAESLGESFL